MGGEYWDNVVEYACNKGLTGIEALSKIPGLAGAAPVQNIGAYGQEIADTLVEIDVYDTTEKSFKTLKKAELEFSYRKSILNSTAKGRYFVISITLLLKSGKMQQPFYKSLEKFLDDNGITDFSPKNIRAAVSAIRADKLPDPMEIASAGSFFKNVYVSDEDADKYESKGYPVYRGKDGNKINSGWLIEQAGLKGQIFHGFKVSEKAALVLINESATSYEDLVKARSEITRKNTADGS
jgi:UDP-N-acetylmuramate dehydrogenase